MATEPDRRDDLLRLLALHDSFWREAARDKPRWHPARSWFENEWREWRDALVADVYAPDVTDAHVDVLLASLHELRRRAVSWDVPVPALAEPQPQDPYAPLRLPDDPTLVRTYLNDVTNQRFWDRTGYKRGHKLRRDDPEDVKRMPEWIRIRYEVAQEAAGQGAPDAGPVTRPVVGQEYNYATTYADLRRAATEEVAKIARRAPFVGYRRTGGGPPRVHFFRTRAEALAWFEQAKPSPSYIAVFDGRDSSQPLAEAVAEVPFMRIPPGVSTSGAFFVPAVALTNQYRAVVGAPTARCVDAALRADLWRANFWAGTAVRAHFRDNPPSTFMVLRGDPVLGDSTDQEEFAQTLPLDTTAITVGGVPLSIFVQRAELTTKVQNARGFSYLALAYRDAPAVSASWKSIGEAIASYLETNASAVTDEMARLSGWPECP